MGKRIRKKQRCSSSSSIVDLNYDVVSEILLNLPVKSLLRFRSVCKSWCSIIDSSAFRKSRRRKNNNDDMLFLQFSRSTNHMFNDWNWAWDPKSVDRSWKFPASFVRVLNLYSWSKLEVDGPINGVIYVYDACPIKDRAHILLCDPVCPKERRILPLSPCLRNCLVGKFIVDGAYSRFIGFGFHDSDYKVVQIIRSVIGVVYVEVYCASTETWRLLDPSKYNGYEMYFHGRERYFGRIKALFNDYVDSNAASIKKTSSGAIAYWMLMGDDDDDEVIVSFDMQNEVFGIIRLPEEYDSEEGVLFGAKDDSQSLVLIDNKIHYLRVWELEIARKERGWAHVTNVDDLQRRGLVPFRKVELWKYGLALRTFQDSEGLWFYDYRTKKAKKCVDLHIRDSRSELFLEYKVTLNSLDTCFN